MDEQLFDTYLERIEKSQHGTTLALGAVAETLRKMNTRLEKQDYLDENEKKEEAMAMEEEKNNLVKQDLIKEITQGVIQSLIKENMALNADKFHSVKHKDVFNKEGGLEDSQVDAKLRTDTGEVQKPIQAMIKEEISKGFIELKKHFLKEHADLYENDDKKEDVLHGKEEEALVSQVEPLPDEEEDEEENGSAEYPMNEEKYDEDVIKSLRKEFSAFKKSFDENVDKKAKIIADEMLKNQGWQKEVSRQPRLIKDKTMGVSDETQIKKSDDPKEDIVKQLAQLSWNELSRMYRAKKIGATDGLPRELIEG